MKYLGKRTVSVIHLIDGVETWRKEENRVVYQAGDGSFKINWMGRHKAVVVDPAKADAFVAYAASKTIKTIDSRGTFFDRLFK